MDAGGLCSQRPTRGCRRPSFPSPLRLLLSRFLLEPWPLPPGCGPRQARLLRGPILGRQPALTSWHLRHQVAVRAEPRASASPLLPSPTSHRPLNTYLVCPVLHHVSVCPPRGLLETQGHGRCPRPHTSGPRPAGQQDVRGGFVEFRVGSGGSCRSPGRHHGSRCGLPNLARLTPPLGPRQRVSTQACSRARDSASPTR